MKIWFESDDDLPLGKKLSIPSTIIVTRSVFQEDNKYYLANKPGEYGKYFMKIRVNSNYNLPLNKILRPYNFTIVVGSFLQEDSKYYLQVFLDEL